MKLTDFFIYRLRRIDEIYTLSEVFSCSIFRFYERKDLKDEDFLAGLTNFPACVQLLN